MKILVAGGCGFVGAAICRRFLAARSGLAITVVDSLRRRGSDVNIGDLETRGVRVIHGDIRVASDIDSLGPFDWVIDAAAEPSVLAGTAAGGRTGRRQLVDHNLTGTVNLLEAAAGWQAGVVLLSTSRVYSIPALCGLSLVERAGRDGAARFTLDGERPLPPGASIAGIAEVFSTAAPVSLYGATKLAGETLALEYAHAAGTPLVIDRCGVLAGAGQFGRADQGIFSWWIHRWAARRPLAYAGFGGRGLQVRDCLHPDDLADLLLLQMAAARGGEPEVAHASGGAANATSLAELSAWCRHRLGPHDVTASPEPRPYDLPWVVLDHAAATARHGWQTAHPPERIFEEIADHAERHPGWLDRCGG
jgi:CDP-paratose 2-epimerase